MSSDFSYVDVPDPGNSCKNSTMLIKAMKGLILGGVVSVRGFVGHVITQETY